MAVSVIKYSGAICPQSDLRVDTFAVLPCELISGDGRKKKKKKEVQTLKIGTWNVRTMNKEGKRENLEREMKKQNIDILGLSEVRWTGDGEVIIGDYKMIYIKVEQRKNTERA